MPPKTSPRKKLFARKPRPKQKDLIAEIRRFSPGLARRVNQYINSVRYRERFDMAELGRSKRPRARQR